MSLQLAAEKEERERAQVRGVQRAIHMQLRCCAAPGMWRHWPCS